MEPMEWIALATLASGLLKTMNENNSYNNQVKAAAEAERWSPYTGRHGNVPQQQPDGLGNMMQSALSAFMLTQGGQANKAIPGSEGPTVTAASSQTMNPYDYMINPQFSYAGGKTYG
jgi:hypothetical protein